MLGQRSSSARLHVELSTSDGVFSEVPDLPALVFSVAPFWWWSSDWWCKHPDSREEQSHIAVTGPHTGEEMYQLYKNRQMKGSNLVVGLATSLPAPQANETIPSAFFRTLAYIFELAKSGATYKPISQSDLARGAPDVTWCRPLWGSYPDRPRALQPANPDASSQALDLSNLSLSDASAAEKLLYSAPWWCYLYSHEPAKEPAKETAKAKKTPPKTAEQMLQYFRDRCLPEWTPVLGLEAGVATYNALPPCLFMTLGSLIRLTAAGASYKALDDNDLQAWDKFSDSRNPTTGSTLGVNPPGPLTSAPLRSSQAGALSRHSSIPQQYPPAMYIPQHQAPHQPSASTFVQFQQSQPPVFPSTQYPTSPASPGLMWYSASGYGGFTANQMFRQPAGGPPLMPAMPVAAMTAVSVVEVPPERTSDLGPSRNAPERTFRTQLSCPTPAHVAARQESRGLERATSTGLQQVYRPAGSRWTTAVFRLFTADATRNHAEASWWYMAPNEAQQVYGPCSDEQMIILYLRGQVTDEHFACGTTSDVGSCPPISQFERVGAVMNGVDTGGEYHLLSAADLMAFSGQGSEPYDRQSYAGAYGSSEAARRRGRLPGPGARGLHGGGTRQFGAATDQALPRW